jgi:hypothetical protein
MTIVSSATGLCSIAAEEFGDRSCLGGHPLVDLSISAGSAKTMRATVSA